jgi:hypothetical protein
MTSVKKAYIPGLMVNLTGSIMGLLLLRQPRRIRGGLLDRLQMLPGFLHVLLQGFSLPEAVGAGAGADPTGLSTEGQRNLEIVPNCPLAT